MIRSISGGRDRGHHVAARVRVPWPSWLGAGGAWGQRARRGRQPALCLSAPLTLAVRHGDVEGLIALIDTFPSRPTLGRPRLLPALLSFLCSGRKRGEVRPRHPWSRGWGRGRELCVARPGERCPYDDGEGEVGSFWGEGLEQAATSGGAGAPHHWGIPRGFPRSCPSPGHFRNASCQLWGNLCPWKDRSPKTPKISGHALLVQSSLRVLVTEGWLLCRARGGLLERTGEGEWSPVPSRHPSEALLRAGKGAALETNAGGMSPLCTEARCPGRSRWSNAFREPSRSRPSTPAAGKRSPIDSALFVMDLF